MMDWEETDRYSFEDSERFEEDSLCSWLSEPESLCNNWRGWRRQLAAGQWNPFPTCSCKKLPHTGEVLSLTQLAARCVAHTLPFEAVEQCMPVIPEQIQLWIGFWSFPDSEEDIRLYSCLANGNSEEFVKGENLYKRDCIQEIIQIGFHLSALVLVATGIKGKFKVAVTFDRGRIIACNCTCGSVGSWCSHVVAVCLHRIHQPHEVVLRAPVSESLSRLQRDQLQKFAQYLISELPQQILPTAQRLIDEILSSQPSDINTVCGAPDPTAGASAAEKSAWWLDEVNLRENIQKIVVKFCVPSPMVYSDVNYLSSTAPPVAAEWQSLLRPLRGREPEGMWNLLSIVREMFKRHDHNAVPLLTIITEECIKTEKVGLVHVTLAWEECIKTEKVGLVHVTLAWQECIKTEKVLVWWYNTRVALHTGIAGHGGKNSMSSSSHSSQYACSSLCDEVVVLWRLAALNPALSPTERLLLMDKLKEWHLKVLDKVDKSKESIGNNGNNSSNGNGNSGGAAARRDADMFPGFRPAIKACLLDWSDYPLLGITYSPSRYYSPVLGCDNKTAFASLLNGGDSSRPGGAYRGDKSRSRSHRSVGTRGVHSRGMSVMWGSGHGTRDGGGGLQQSASSSSMSSEGFCDNEPNRDADSPQPEPLPRPQASRGDRHLGANRGRSGASGSSGDRRGGFGGRTVGVSYHGSANVSVAQWVNSHQRRPAQPPAAGAAGGAGGSPPNSYQFQQNFQVPGMGDAGPAPAAPTVPPAGVNSNNPAGENVVDVFCNLRKLEDPSEILLARAEGLHAHGHLQEASAVAVRLAEELLASPPNLLLEPLPSSAARNKRKKVHPASHQSTILASATLGKCAFLCSVLGDLPQHTHLAFKLALFGLEMPRHPASTKPLEVKLAHQELELVNQLKRMALGAKELNVIREKAEELRSGLLRSRGHALLPLMLAAFVFDALVNSNGVTRSPGASGEDPLSIDAVGRMSDETAGFEAAVAALAMKANVSEADHPLLCEGTRKQRGELALTLLTHYKDNQARLSAVMDKFLDKEVHQMYKSPSMPPAFYAPLNQISTAPVPVTAASVDPDASKTGSLSGTPPSVNGRLCLPPSGLPSSSPSSPLPSTSSSSSALLEHGMACMTLSNDARAGKDDRRVGGSGGVEEGSCTVPGSLNCAGVSAGEGWEEHYKAWEQKNNKHRKKRGCGARAASDSGSSGNSSDSVASCSSTDKLTLENKALDPSQVSCHMARPQLPPTPDPLTAVRPPPNTSYGKGVRYKGKRAYPTLPNQPSEANAYFMFEMAKTVLSKAGGNSSSSLFKQPSSSQNHRGPHRALQMCAFQIGLYALGLHNCVSHNWLSRTYSSHVSWISNQAIEIGASALSFLINTWEGHLTPQEAASIADKASRGCDSNTIREAARLALSCLPHAHALNPNEIQRAIIQCKEQSPAMLERACLAIEGAAKGGGSGGVYPEVLFQVARCWFQLYETRSRHLPHNPILVSGAAMEMPLDATQNSGPLPSMDLTIATTTSQPLHQNRTTATTTTKTRCFIMLFSGQVTGAGFAASNSNNSIVSSSNAPTTKPPQQPQHSCAYRPATYSTSNTPYGPVVGPPYAFRCSFVPTVATHNIVHGHLPFPMYMQQAPTASTSTGGGVASGAPPVHYCSPPHTAPLHLLQQANGGSPAQSSMAGMPSNMGPMLQPPLPPHQGGSLYPVPGGFPVGAQNTQPPYMPSPASHGMAPPLLARPFYHQPAPPPVSIGGCLYMTL
ncbi:Zinc finger SWIM-type [Trinorchestia longiramus]|nr:Zinc finger SWIM-type [Trinorchestia longiramus]